MWTSDTHDRTFGNVLMRACVPDACSSRSTPRPRPPSPTMRPNITFQTYACPPAYAAWYCLNGATCFTVKIDRSILYNCEWVSRVMWSAEFCIKTCEALLDTTIKCRVNDMLSTIDQHRETLYNDKNLICTHRWGRNENLATVHPSNHCLIYSLRESLIFVAYKTRAKIEDCQIFDLDSYCLQCYIYQNFIDICRKR